MTTKPAAAKPEPTEPEQAAPTTVAEVAKELGTTYDFEAEQVLEARKNAVKAEAAIEALKASVADQLKALRKIKRQAAKEEADVKKRIAGRAETAATLTKFAPKK